MSDPTPHELGRHASYDLPESAQTRDGYLFQPRKDDWRIVTDTKSSIFHFGELNVTKALKTCFKRFVLTKLRGENTSSVKLYYEFGQRLLRHISSYDDQAVEVSSIHLINYQAALAPNQLYRSTGANDVVRAWARLGLPGVSQQAFVTAAEMPRHSLPKGRAVRLRCPIHGAYSNLEFDGLNRALHAAFSSAEVSIEKYALCLLSMAITPRPIQIASLLVKDLKIRLGASGKDYILSVPRAKQRGGGYRTQFTERPLVEEIGMVIEAQASLVRERARNSGMLDPDQAPLFPARHPRSIHFESDEVPARPSAASIAARIKDVMESLDVKSERTGCSINVTASRARRTAGTRAAQDGRSVAEIAAILDHSTLKAAMLYVEMRSDLIRQLDRKVAMLLAPMAQRFSGVLALRNDDGAHGIERRVFGSFGEDARSAEIGGCGKHGFCGLGKPTACYTCRLFHPWLDGPHEAMLDHLLLRRGRMAADGSLIVAAVLDETILACAEVVRQCAAAASVLGGECHG
ncbi:site-specific integrase [Bosea rubneri]|uniref:Site-specific integrase n=1 Tax=Bosea rubneri TaxID=3075434 RepID=A0ABU3SCF4_9HYPH|nr:site-specific integrase [Bosea sp. ZW T0_25]MDU0342072.1 site-specific integrase [Bosea sp. ZW T0_25]